MIRDLVNKIVNASDGVDQRGKYIPRESLIYYGADRAPVEKTAIFISSVPGDYSFRRGPISDQTN